MAKEKTSIVDIAYETAPSLGPSESLTPQFFIECVQWVRQQRLKIDAQAEDDTSRNASYRKLSGKASSLAHDIGRQLNVNAMSVIATGASTDGSGNLNICKVPIAMSGPTTYVSEAKGKVNRTTGMVDIAAGRLIIHDGDEGVNYEVQVIPDETGSVTLRPEELIAFTPAESISAPVASCLLDASAS